MRQVFLTIGIVGLMSCSNTEEPTVTPTPCCDTDTLQYDTVDTLQYDTVGVDTPFNTDSITTVSDLLDSLAPVEPKVTEE